MLCFLFPSSTGILIKYCSPHLQACVFQMGDDRVIEKYRSKANTCFSSREGTLGYRCIPWHRMKKTNWYILCWLDSEANSPLESQCQGLKHSSKHPYQNHQDHPSEGQSWEPAATSPADIPNDSIASERRNRRKVLNKWLDSPCPTSFWKSISFCWFLDFRKI